MRLVFCGCRGLALSLALVVAGLQSADAQTMYLRGQSVQPVFEGWEQNPDGTYTMWFGYMNRNYVEEPLVAVGENNFFSPGPADRGQPTHFYVRRQNFMFSTVVPADWEDKKLVWTLPHQGEDHTAVGWLFDPGWGVDEGVWRANRSTGIRGRGDRTYFINEPPTVRILGQGTVMAFVEEPVTLTAWASDDGDPGPGEPREPRPQDEEVEEALPIVNFLPFRTGGPIQQQVVNYRTAVATGLALTWLHHRGPGKVTFSPQAEGLEPGNEISTSVIFSEPGTYVIRAAADDTGFVRYADVRVEVRQR